MPETDFRRLGLRMLLALPTPALRILAGGGVECSAGRTLDPRLQFLASQARGQPRPDDLVAARGEAAERIALWSGRPSLRVEWEALAIPGPAGLIDARAYHPAGQGAAAPVMVFAHGGGVVGDLETRHVFCSLLAETAAMPVLQIAYRLAPEHRFPAALEDLQAAYRFAREEAAARFGATSGRVAIGGDGLGAGLAAAMAQASPAGEAPTLQLLVCPLLDVASEVPSMTRHADAWPLSRADLDWALGYYLSPGDNPADSRLSPLRAASLAGLPPAVIATAGFDPLADQGAAYAARLIEAGVGARLLVFDELAHGFAGMTGVCPAALAACRAIGAAVAAQLVDAA